MVKSLFKIIALGCVFLSAAPSVAQVNKGSLDQQANQAQGNYDPVKILYQSGNGSIGMLQNAWKDPLQHMGEGQSKPGYSRYYWSPGSVLPIRTRQGMYTLVNFPSWELIEDIVWGDSNSFTITEKGPSSILITPNPGSMVGVDTNMIAIGRSGNKYAFYLQSEAINTDRITNTMIDIIVGKNGGEGNTTGSNGGKGEFSYADVNGNGVSDGTGSASLYTKNLQKSDWIENIPIDPTKFRFDIEVYVPNPDDIIIAPERVWRDNIFTYIDLGDKTLTSVQRPVVSLIVERSETPVGFRAAGPNNRLIIVEAMGDMVLRSGKRMVCLKLRRSDKDGLENAVYAKTDDWDIQTPQKDNFQNEYLGSADNDLLFEDVYNGSPDLTQKQIEPTIGNNVDGFFNSNVFSTEKNENLKDNKYNNVKEIEPINSSKSQNNAEINAQDRFAQSLDSLPKATPVVVPTLNTENVESEPKTENLKAKQVIHDFDKKTLENESITPTKNINNEIKQDVASSSKIINDKNNSKTENDKILQNLMSDSFYTKKRMKNISLELGTDENINNLEKLWNKLSKKYFALLSKKEPFYSIDTPADGQGEDVFHLKVGPIESIEEGDNICTQLGRNGVFCSVVRAE